MKVTTPAFANGQEIPDRHVYERDNTSPPLKFTDVPEATKTFAIIVDDPDAPHGTFDHWLAWNIDGKLRELPENAKVPHQGLNHYGNTKYDGPCPPPGKPHRYFFKVYALDSSLKLPDGSTKKQLEQAIEGHVLGKAEVVGIYQR